MLDVTWIVMLSTRCIWCMIGGMMNSRVSRLCASCSGMYVWLRSIAAAPWNLGGAVSGALFWIGSGRGGLVLIGGGRSRRLESSGFVLPALGRAPGGMIKDLARLSSKVGIFGNQWRTYTTADSLYCRRRRKKRLKRIVLSAVFQSKRYAAQAAYRLPLSFLDAIG